MGGVGARERERETHTVARRNTREGEVRNGKSILSNQMYKDARRLLTAQDTSGRLDGSAELWRDDPLQKWGSSAAGEVAPQGGDGVVRVEERRI